MEISNKSNSKLEKQDPLLNFPQWIKLRKDLQENDQDSDLFESLISYIEDQVSSHLKIFRGDTELRKIIHEDFDGILMRFPYLTNYWKRYITIEYTLNGLQPSVAILERAVTAFPSSLDLWLDYINIIIANKLENETVVKKLFEDAVSHVGRQFMSHTIWDIYLDWESKTSGEHSNDYLNILLRIIQLPLHQYARYCEKFYEIMANFTLEDLIPESDVEPAIHAKYPDLSLQDLDTEQRKEITDLYFDNIFNASYEGVNARWVYESELEKQEFDLLPVSQDEITKWVKYIDFEETQGNIPQIQCLYERALIPTCSYQTIWMKYLKFLINKSDGKGNKDEIVGVFRKACDVFLSTDQMDVRYMFAKYYQLKLDDVEMAKKIYLNLITSLPTEYEPISKYFKFLVSIKDEKAANESAISVVRLFCRDKYQLKTNLNQKKRKLQPSSIVIKDNDFKKLYAIVTYKNVSQLVVEVAKIYWLSRNQIKETRDLLISFFKEDLMKCSLPYWSFFFKFELAQKNKKNLTNIMNFLKYYGQLPIPVINNMITTYVNFMFQNSTAQELGNISREMQRYLLETDDESSMHMKHFLKSRLDPGSDEEVINKRLIKENGHPGCISEHRPRLVTPIDFGTSLLDQKEAASIPTFKNVEKATAHVKYIQESI